MTDHPRPSKEARQEKPQEAEDNQPSDYYYDDSTGYRIYDDDGEGDNQEDEPSEDS